MPPGGTPEGDSCTFPLSSVLGHKYPLRICDDRMNALQRFPKWELRLFRSQVQTWFTLLGVDRVRVSLHEGSGRTELVRSAVRASVPKPRMERSAHWRSREQRHQPPDSGIPGSALPRPSAPLLFSFLSAAFLSHLVPRAGKKQSTTNCPLCPARAERSARTSLFPAVGKATGPPGGAEVPQLRQDLNSASRTLVPKVHTTS